ncbi:MAG: hypothetical protein F6K42_18990 [Leptolyngbya sp. SIO1D8]|nr:hypothetical protein [Leptolyngbya sp. SIO1D8]
MAQVLKTKSSVRWRSLLVKGTFWLSSEIVLGLIGVDTLADYSEFLMQSRVTDHLSQAVATITTLM